MLCAYTTGLIWHSVCGTARLFLSRRSFLDVSSQLKEEFQHGNHSCTNLLRSMLIFLADLQLILMFFL